MAKRLCVEVDGHQVSLVEWEGEGASARKTGRVCYLEERNGQKVFPGAVFPHLLQRPEAVALGNSARWASKEAAPVAVAAPVAAPVEYVPGMFDDAPDDSDGGEFVDSPPPRD